MKQSLHYQRSNAGLWPQPDHLSLNIDHFTLVVEELPLSPHAGLPPSLWQV